jgi:hypothetical protein
MDVNQILAKAMSTSSEEEAIACLRMARKRGGQISGQADTHNQHGAKHWYEKARDYYTIAKKRTEEVEEYYRMYTRERDKKCELETEVRLLKAKIEKRDAKWDYVIPACMALVMFSIVFIGILSKG